MEPNTTNRNDFIPYPTNRVVGTVADATHAQAAINALLQAGFAEHDIDILHVAILPLNLSARSSNARASSGHGIPGATSRT